VQKDIILKTIPLVIAISSEQLRLELQVFHRFKIMKIEVVSNRCYFWLVGNTSVIKIGGLNTERSPNGAQLPVITISGLPSSKPLIS